MNKELIDKAWACLPKEFKEEVKDIYLNTVVCRPCGYNHKTDLLKYLFGVHNLTSDAEGEEMLTLPRKAIIQAYKKSCAKSATKYNVGYADCLYNLFGSKCLPYETKNGAKDRAQEPKPAESKEDKHFDNILKEDFRGHNRLHIAAMMVPSVIATVPCSENEKGYAKMVATRARILADALISECKKGGVE